MNVLLGDRIRQQKDENSRKEEKFFYGVIVLLKEDYCLFSIMFVEIKVSKGSKKGSFYVVERKIREEGQVWLC